MSARKFLYNNKEYKSTKAIAKTLGISLSNLMRIIYKSNKERGNQYKFIVENFEILNKLKYWDEYKKEYTPVLKYNDKQIYIDKYLEQSQRRGNSVIQYKFRFEGEYLNGIEALWSKLYPVIGDDLSRRAFRKIITHQESTYFIKKEETLDVLSSVEVYDVVLSDYRNLVDRNKISLIEHRRPVYKRVDNRFDNFLITEGLFTDKYDRDKVNSLINQAIAKEDYYTFAILIHDLIINLLGGSYDVFQEPLYEQEPDDFAYYTVEICYEKVFESDDLVNPKEWTLYCKRRCKRRIIDNFRLENFFEESHSIDYINKSSVFDSELDLAVKKLSGLGVITYDLIEDKPLIKKLTLSELVDYLLDNFCLINSSRGVVRIALLESIKRKRIYLNKLDKKYHNSLIYLFNQYRLLTKDS